MATASGLQPTSGLTKSSGDYTNQFSNALSLDTGYFDESPHRVDGLLMHEEYLIIPGEVKANNPSLTLKLETNVLIVTSEPLQAGQDRLAVTHPSNSYARRRLTQPPYPLHCDIGNKHNSLDYPCPLKFRASPPSSHIHFLSRILTPLVLCVLPHKSTPDLPTCRELSPFMRIVAFVHLIGPEAAVILGCRGARDRPAACIPAAAAAAYPSSRRLHYHIPTPDCSRPLTPVYY
ncbi:hypothetical protein J6590_052187 [Homalodisca vitripennis]|nr:hypothetical protein J6590_052187 [Homalodisca vitripennis]